MSKKILSCFNDGDKIFETTLPGISLAKLKKFCDATNCKTSDYLHNGKHYVPGVFIIAMFRYIVVKLHKENPEFPFKRISGFYGSNGGTTENRVFVNQDLTYGLKFLSKDNEGKIQFRVEVKRSNNNEIVLAGLFQFVA